MSGMLIATREREHRAEIPMLVRITRELLGLPKARTYPGPFNHNLWA